MSTLKTLREQQNLTQAELAQMAGLSQAHISDLENGTKSPGLRAALGIAKALGMTVETVFGVANEQANEQSEVTL